MICVIHDCGDIGGSSLSMIDLIKMLRENNEVIACIPQFATSLKRKLVDEKINVYEVKNVIPRFSYYSGSKSIFSRTVLKQIFSFCHEDKFVHEIEGLKPDVIIFNSLVTCLSSRKFNKNIKKICFVRETFKQTKIDRLFRNVLENYFDGVCFIAEHEKKFISLKKTMTRVIPDCLEPRKINILDKKEACMIEKLVFENKYILFLGGIDPIKGVDYILKAMCMLEQEYILLIAGYFDLDKLNMKYILKYLYNPFYVLFLLRTRFYYNKLRKQQRLICTGFRDDISTLMSCCDVVVFPSRHPHQPRPAIEAGEFKKTVILSDFKATTEFFIDGFNALTFKPHNAKDLARKIRTLGNDRVLNDKLSKANYKMTREKHNYSDTQNSLRNFINICLNKNSIDS